MEMAKLKRQFDEKWESLLKLVEGGVPKAKKTSSPVKEKEEVVPKRFNMTMGASVDP